MRPQDNKPNTNSDVIPNPVTPPTLQAASTSNTEISAPTNTTNSSTAITEPTLSTMPESTNNTVQPATLTQVLSDSLSKNIKANLNFL